jgi:CBS domain
MANLVVLRVTDLANASHDDTINNIITDLDDVVKVSPDAYLDSMKEEYVQKYMVVYDEKDQIVGTVKPSDIIRFL